MPNLPVFNVMSYGATGSGTTDDTVAIRNAIAAAVASNGGIVYFPAGTYAVCHQPGDADPFVTAQIFTITSSSLVFLGEGADKSHISGYMPGLQNPVTHWNNNPDPNAYSKISRFSMFFLAPSSAPITNVQFRSLEIIGNAGYTGNSTVGGIQSNGDGWDMTHKCIGLVGGQPSDVLIFNCSLNRWRGEIVYGGGNQGKGYLINSHIFSANSSALSFSGDVLVNHSTVGGTNANDDIYNGVENFCLGAPQKTVIQDSTIMCGSATNRHGNGVAYLGLPTSSLLVERSGIYNCEFGILFSEFGYNVIVRNSTFTNNANASITSIMGMYPTYAQYEGFANFLIGTNTFDNSGCAFVNQFYGNGFTLDNVAFNGNTITHGNLLGGANDGPLGKPYTGFVADGNTLGVGGVDADCEVTARSQCLLNVASWKNTVRYNTLNTSNSKYWLNCNGVTNAAITPSCDITVVNDNGGAPTVNVAIAAAVLPGYPMGFTTKIINGPANRAWIVKADSSWNTFASDQPVGSTGVTIRMNAQGKFDLGSGDGGTNYTITASAGSNGSIAPSGSVSVPSGSNNTFTISGNSGYVVTNVVVDGSSIGASNTYTFVNVTTGHTISALFGSTSTNYTITASAGSNGSIAPSGSVSVPSGSNKTFTISGNSGYVVTNVVVDGSSIGASNTYTFVNVTTGHTISALFGSTSTNYTITASAGANGSITPSGAVSVPSGSNKTFTISVNNGYSIASVLVDGSSVGTPSSYTFNNVTSNHAISASFNGSAPAGFSAWTNRMLVSFSGYNRPETLTNFPALVVLNTGTAGFSYSQFASTNGNDLRFSADGTTELNYEIEQWNQGGSSYVWVQVPQLASGSYIWAYWGNAGAASGPAAYTLDGSTWPSNAFAAVWHMGRSNTLDSTANANNGTAAGSISSASGIVGGAQYVTGGGHVTFSNSGSLDFVNPGVTYSGWVKFNTLPGGEQVLMRKEQNREIGFSDSGHVRSMLKTGGTTGWTAGNDDAITPVVGQWYYLAFTYDGSTLRNFWNGVPLSAGHGVTGSIVGDPYTMSIGAYNGNGDGGPVTLGLDAIIDEVRVEQVFRSTNWIWATYLTVASNASFSVYGSVQTGGSTNTPPAGIPPGTWMQRYFPGTPTNNYASLAGSCVNSNGMTVWQDYVAGMNPTNGNSCFSVIITNMAGQILVIVPSVQTNSDYSGMNRYYEIDECTNLSVGGSWQPAPGYSGLPASGGFISCTNSAPGFATFYRAKARLQ
jgi:hypothetical protein